jgi:hypothetical protein
MLLFFVKILDFIRGRFVNHAIGTRARTVPCTKTFPLGKSVGRLGQPLVGGFVSGLRRSLLDYHVGIAFDSTSVLARL